MQKVIEAANKLLADLMAEGKNVRLGITAYSQDASVVLPFGKYEDGVVLKVNRYTGTGSSNGVITAYNNANRVINSNYKSGGYANYTNTQAGFDLAMEMLETATNTANRKPVVILLTDGAANTALDTLFDADRTGTVRQVYYSNNIDPMIALSTLLSAAYAGFELLQPQVSGFGLTVAMGAVNGVLFLGGFVLCQWNTRKNGIVLTSVFMKLGLLVPMAVSVLIFHDLPTGAQIAGFCLALIAIALLNVKKGSGGNRLRWQLPVMLLMCGGADAMSKVFEVLGPPVLADQFLFYTFAVALALCVAMVLYRKERPGVWELVFGAAIGIPNFFASKFLLLALNRLQAVVVFPSFSIGTILVVTVAGVLFFKERLQKLQWLALASIIAALFLLNI